MTAAMKVIWAKPASGTLPCTASGTPAARRATAPAVVTAAARTPTETVVRGSVLVNRDGACSTAVSGDVVTVDMLGSFSLAAVACAPLTMSTNGEGGFDTEAPYRAPMDPSFGTWAGKYAGDRGAGHWDNAPCSLTTGRFSDSG